MTKQDLSLKCKIGLVIENQLMSYITLIESKQKTYDHLKTQKEHLTKIQYPFMIKLLNKQIEGCFLNLMKSIYKKPTTNLLIRK